MFTDAKSDGWGAEDMAEDTLVEFVPVLLDLIEQTLQVPPSPSLHSPATAESQSGMP